AGRPDFATSSRKAWAWGSRAMCAAPPAWVITLKVDRRRARFKGSARHARFTAPGLWTIVSTAPSPRREGGETMWRIAWGLAVWLLAAVAAPSAHAQGAKETLSVDLPGEPATLDPHVQWDTDSYHVYRNIFDNLVTRAPDGKIVPQIAKAWRYES